MASGYFAASEDIEFYGLNHKIRYLKGGVTGKNYNGSMNQTIVRLLNPNKPANADPNNTTEAGKGTGEGSMTASKLVT